MLIFAIKYSQSSLMNTIEQKNGVINNFMKQIIGFQGVKSTIV